MPALYELSGEEIVRVRELPAGPCSLGRDLSNQIVLHDPTVSRFHCRLIIDRDESWVEDLDSQNGTYVSGRLIRSTSRLFPGARLQLGKLILLYWGEFQNDATNDLSAMISDSKGCRTDEFYKVRVSWRFGWNFIAWRWRVRRR